MKLGVRVYVLIVGGIDVLFVMGSKLIYIRVKIGGFEGRVFKKGDYINIFI